MELPCDSFVVTFRVHFDDFSNNYPMCFTTENGSIQCHGCGPTYGRDQGRICLYIYTKSGSGPHGRGISGTIGGASHNEGWVKSVPIKVGQWHDIKIEKTRRTLSIAVDGKISACEVPEDMSDSDFDMRTPGKCLLSGLNEKAEHRLHGTVTDFRILRNSNTPVKFQESTNIMDGVAVAAPIISAHSASGIAEGVVLQEAVAVMTTIATATVSGTNTMSGDVAAAEPKSLCKKLSELNEALSDNLISQDEFAAMRQAVISAFPTDSVGSS